MLNFGRHLSSTAVELPAKVQSNSDILMPNFADLRLDVLSDIVADTKVCRGSVQNVLVLIVDILLAP